MWVFLGEQAWDKKHTGPRVMLLNSLGDLIVLKNNNDWVLL